MSIARYFLVAIFSLLVIGCSKDAEQQQQVAEVEKIDGKLVYDNNCAACHNAGTGHPGTMRLAIRLGEEKSVLTDRADLNEQYVRTIVRQGILLMPPFRPSEITDPELDALADYLAKPKG